MSGHEPTLKNKVSPHIDSQLPDFIRQDHPLFSLFLKYYYEFLEAGELTLTGTNDYVIEETITKNFIVGEDGEKIVLEESVGKFTVGETITGATSGATARVLVDDFDDNKRLFITSQQRFETGETVTGNTSGATSTVGSYRANPVQNIQQLLAYADVDNTVYSFLDKFRDSFMEALPNTVADGLSKRKLVKNIKDMYAAKGTEAGHKLFFRILFDEEAEIIYPRDSLLRPSDGQWTTDKVIRIVEDGTSDFNKAVGEFVTGATSGAKAIIATVIKFREGATLIAELNLDANSVTGEFTAGEVVTTTDTTLDLEISGVVKSMVVEGTVAVGGAYYETNDPVTVTGGGGNDAATARVESAGSGSIDEIMIEDGGSGYSIGDELVFDLANTEGKDVRAKVAVVGGSFLLEPDTAPDHFITQDGDMIITEDRDYLNQEETVGDLDYLVLETGEQIILEEETFNDLGASSEIGEITKVKMVNRGNGFTKLPTVTVTPSSSGTGASLFAASTVSPMVGHVEGISVTNFGLNYTNSPVFTLNRVVLVKNVSGNFTAGDELVSHDGTVVNFDDSTNLLELKTSVVFDRGDVITSITGATATVHQSTHAQATSSVGTVGTTVGQFISDRGKVSVDTMKIQDSFYYQDYSYVVRIGQSINEWRESVRRSVHPAGWNVFGEVSFASLVSATIQSPAAGDVGDSVSDETFTPELASTFTNLFTTIFGRRLGTTTDSTQRVNANVSVAEPSELAAGERDVTLTTERVVSLRTGRGRHLLGSTLDNLPKYAFAVPPITDNDDIPNYPGLTRNHTVDTNRTRDLYTLDQWGTIRIDQVSINLSTGKTMDGDLNTFDLTYDVTFDNETAYVIPDNAYTTKTNVQPPSEIKVTNTAGTFSRFSSTDVGFDNTNRTFDIGLISSDGFSSGITTFDDSSRTFDTE